MYKKMKSAEEFFAKYWSKLHNKWLKWISCQISEDSNKIISWIFYKYDGSKKEKVFYMEYREITVRRDL